MHQPWYSCPTMLYEGVKEPLRTDGFPKGSRVSPLVIEIGSVTDESGDYCPCREKSDLASITSRHSKYELISAFLAFYSERCVALC
jgi:hypothetical protein